MLFWQVSPKNFLTKQQRERILLKLNYHDIQYLKILIMISKIIDDNVICLCKIIETLKEKYIVETYIEKLNSIQKNKDLPKRLVFALMDTIESIET